MTFDSSYRKEIILLAEALFERTLTEEDARRLEHLVSKYPEAAEFYLERVELHGELHRMYQEGSSDPSAAPILGGLTGDTSVAPPPKTGHGGMFLGWAGLGTSLMLTGVLLIAATAWWFWPDAGQPGSVAPIARLTAASDCVWSPNESVSVGEALPPGKRVAVSSGDIEITYENGTRVNLRGPAAYRVTEANQGFLEEGDITVDVPEQATGFTVDTSEGAIIDLGTKFRVRARRDKAAGVSTTDVRVIDGTIDVGTPFDASNPRVSSRFKTGEAVRLSSLQATGDKSENAPRNPLPPAARKPFDPRTVQGLRLWFSADAGVLSDQGGRVMKMTDLVGGYNLVTEDAAQARADARPHWIRQGVGGHPVFAFAGRQYLELAKVSDLCFRDESLTIFVVGNAHGHTQYFVAGKGGKWKGRHKGFRFSTSLDCGLRYQADQTVSVVRACETTRHNVFGVVHDRRIPGRNTVTLYCNGQQLGQIEPVEDSNIENVFPLTIGANPEAIYRFPDSPQNYLKGEIAEILIYDRVLDELDRQRIESHLTVRYGLEPELPDRKKLASSRGSHQIP